MPDLFEISYLVGFIAGSAVRYWYILKVRQDRLKIFREEGALVGILASLWGVAILTPLIPMYSTWLDFARYNPPDFLSWLGVPTFIIAIWLLWRSHADLARNWSVTTEIKEGHKLVTGGVFRYIRHPMYLAHFLWGIAQLLLIENWIAGPASLVVFLPLYLLRVGKEERLMLKEFGDEYLSYMKRTGRLFPRFGR